ncbi:DNA methyltransferase [Klebsiella pneumoniae]
MQLTVTDAVFAVPAYGPQNDVTLKMPAFEWVHVQLHQQKGMISLSPPTICNSAMVSFYGWNRVDRFMAAWKNAGFSVVGHLVFTKNYTSKAAYVGYRHECAYILAKGRPRLPQNPLPDVLGWKYSGNRHHPTEKPVTSLQPLIESFTHPNAIVLDPFAGSGSTCVAALQSGRRYIGIELLEQYHRAGQQRLAAVQRAMQQGAANDDWFMPEAA